MSSIEQTLGEFYRAFDPTKDLPADDKRYYPLDDPVEGERLRGGPSVRTLLHTTIQRAQDPTAQLISGFRGAGKTTELRRLAAELQIDNFAVVYGDAGSYLNLSAPLDLTNLLLSIAGSISCETRKLVGAGFTGGAPFIRALKTVLGGSIELDSLEFDMPGFKGKLRLDPAFGEKVHASARLRQSEFIRAFQEFVTTCISAIREAQESRGVVFIFDSLEHLQGDVSTADKVFDSVRIVFSQFSEALRLPDCHSIYSVPPYLRVLLPGAPGQFAGGDVRLLPMVKLWGRDPSRSKYDKGVDALVRLVERRFDWKRVFGNDRTLLERMILASGGYLRDLFRLLQETTYEVDTLPLGEAKVTQAIHAVARSYRGLADADKEWLRRVRDERSLCLPAVTELRRHAQLFDTHLIFCYRNDEEWYDVHPLIRDWLGTDGSRIV